jgi:putative transcriptional regulator
MIRHHPSPEILADYARGSLDAGAMLVIACHVHDCVICRSETGLWENAGGAMLETLELAAMNDGALEKALARLDTLPAAPKHRLPRYMQEFDVPAPLARQHIGFRRWVTPSIWFAPVHMGAQSEARTYLVYARAGTTLAQHTHRGPEYTQLVHGSFADGTGSFARGDFACVDEDILHAPAVTLESSCLCLSHSEEPMQLTGRVARLIQSVLGTLY